MLQFISCEEIILVWLFISAGDYAGDKGIGGWSLELIHMRYLFWNTNKKKGINKYLKQLIFEYRPDIVGLAEYDDNMDELINMLLKTGQMYYSPPSLGSRIVTISKFKNELVKHGTENTYFVVKGYPYNNGEIHNVVFVHLLWNQILSNLYSAQRRY